MKSNIPLLTAGLISLAFPSVSKAVCCDGNEVPTSYKCCTPAEKQAAQEAYQTCEADARNTAMAEYARADAAWETCHDNAVQQKDDEWAMANDLKDASIDACIAAIPSGTPPPMRAVMEFSCGTAADAAFAPVFNGILVLYATREGICLMDWETIKGAADGQFEIDMAQCHEALMVACDND